MRLIEGLLLVMVASLPTLEILGTSPIRRPFGLGISIGLSILQQLMEGFRWQLVPAYIALTVEACVTYYKAVWPGISVYVHSFSIVLLITSFAMCFGFPVFKIRSPDGPFATATLQLEWTDESRPAWDLYKNRVKQGPRRLPVRIWYPIPQSLASDDFSCAVDYLPHVRRRVGYFSERLGLPAWIAGHFHLIKAHSRQPRDPGALLPLEQSIEKYPVMFFSHGYASAADFSTILAEQMASYGVIVVAVEHAFDAAVTYYASNDELVPFDAAPPIDVLKNEEEFWKFRGHHLAIRTADVLFCANVLKQLNKGGNVQYGPELATLLHNRIDTANFMAIGHSFGGATAINLCNSDPAFRTAVGLDAWLSPLPKQLKQSGLRVPILLIQARQFPDEDRFWSSSNRQDSIDAVRRSPGSRLYIVDDATHQDFLDLVVYAPIVSRLLRITGPHGQKIQEFVCSHVVEHCIDIGFIPRVASHCQPRRHQHSDVIHLQIESK